MKYFFILGKNNDLSVLEILTLFKTLSISVLVDTVSDDVLVIESKKKINTDEIMRLTGGIIKSGIVVSSDVFDVQKKDEMLLSIKNTLINVLDIDKKIYFGFSLYSLKKTLKQIPLFKKKKYFFQAGVALKKILSQAKIQSRFVVSQDIQLSSVVVTKNRLLKNGADICLFFLDEQKFYIGITKAVQDFELFSYLDYGRPARSGKRGMLPPKLAQMMINIAGISPTQSIFDPFCGSGTVLTQAYLSGYRQIIGSDMNAQAVADTKDNIAWVQSNFGYPDAQIRVFHSDIQRVLNKLKKQTIDAVVTEPYMGPPLTGQEKKEKLFSIVQELVNLYKQMFIVTGELLKKGGSFVVVLPIFKYHAELLHIPVSGLLKNTGLQVQTDFQEDVHYTERGSLVYKREDQYLYRELFVLRKK